MSKENPQVTLADGTVFPCDFFGYAESIGLQYIDIPEIGLAEAAAAFSDPNKTSTITFENLSETSVKEGFTVCTGITVNNGVCRIRGQRQWREKGRCPGQRRLSQLYHGGEWDDHADPCRTRAVVAGHCRRGGSGGRGRRCAAPPEAAARRGSKRRDGIIRKTGGPKP